MQRKPTKGLRPLSGGFSEEPSSALQNREPRTVKAGSGGLSPRCAAVYFRYSPTVTSWMASRGHLIRQHLSIAADTCRSLSSRHQRMCAPGRAVAEIAQRLQRSPLWGTRVNMFAVLVPFPRLTTTVRFEHHALPEQRRGFLNWADPPE